MKRNIMTVTVVENRFYFNVLCIDKQKDIQTNFNLNYTIENNNNSLGKQLDSLGKTIRQDLISRDYFKYPVIVNLNLDEMFIENLEIPRLSKKEMTRAIHLELAKLYGDFERRFAFSILNFPLNKQICNVKIALYDLESYRSLLTFFKETRLKIERITLAPYNLKNLILSKKMVDKSDSPNLIININKQYTTIIVQKNKFVITYDIINSGFSGFNNNLFNLLELWKEEELFSRDLKREIKRNFDLIFNEVYRISGSLVAESTVDIYLHIEGESKNNLIKALELNYGISINKLESAFKNLLATSAITRPNRNYDFTFLMRLSDEERY